MTTLKLAEREIPVRGGYDVFVAGAGMAGVAAAVCAARDGLRTAIVEYFGAPGGIPTTGQLQVISGHKWQGKTIVGGFLDEVQSRVASLGGFREEHMSCYAPEALKRVLLDLLEEAGVETFLFTQLVDAAREGDRVTHAVTASKSGFEAFESKLFIDDTGDGDLAAMVGCPFEKGRQSDGLMQSATLVFRMAGIDRGKAPSPEEMCGTWTTVPHEFPINHLVLMWPPDESGTVRVNMVHILRFDGTKNTELTRARFEGTRQAAGILEFFRKNVAGFENAYIDITGEQIGVRETRRITGDYILTEEDVLEGRSFEDQVALCGWPIDIHNPDGIHTGVGQWPAGPYGIPYRCITPKGAENLYVVGRPISSTHEANSSSRLNSACTALGQAAGCAARMALEAGGVRKIDVDALLKKLRTQGAILSAEEGR